MPPYTAAAQSLPEPRHPCDLVCAIKASRRISALSGGRRVTAEITAAANAALTAADEPSP